MSDDVLDARTVFVQWWVTGSVEHIEQTHDALHDSIAAAHQDFDALMRAFSAAGYVVLRDPSGTARHGDTLVRVEAEVGPVVDDEDDWRALARHEVFLLRRSVPDLESAAPNPSPTPETWFEKAYNPEARTAAEAIADYMEQRPLKPATVTCPECGGRGRRGCGAAWHDGKPDDAPSPADEAIARRGGAGTPVTPERNQPSPEQEISRLTVANDPAQDS